MAVAAPFFVFGGRRLIAAMLHQLDVHAYLCANINININLVLLVFCSRARNGCVLLVMLGLGRIECQKFPLHVPEYRGFQPRHQPVVRCMVWYGMHDIPKI